MDPKLVKMAKEIPSRLKDVMNSMFEQSQPALKSGVNALRDSLKKLDSYLGDVEKEHLNTAPSGGSGTARSASAAPAARRRRKSGKRFPISDFVLGELTRAGKALRPVELAEKLSEATGRAKASALSNINTLLARLRQTKKVTSKDGLYSATGSARAAATSTAAAASKPTAKRRRGGKRFQTGPFVVATLKKSAKGMRPVDVAKALALAAPGQHKSPISVVNTTLKRLKDQGQVVNRKGIWSTKAA